METKSQILERISRLEQKLQESRKSADFFEKQIKEAKKALEKAPFTSDFHKSIKKPVVDCELSAQEGKTQLLACDNNLMHAVNTMRQEYQCIKSRSLTAKARSAEWTQRIKAVSNSNGVEPRDVQSVINVLTWLNNQIKSDELRLFDAQ